MTPQQSTTDSDWEQRMALLWTTLDDVDPEDFRTRIAELAAEQPDPAIARFELGAANDSTGRPEVAVPLYQAALATGLTGLRRRRAVIQQASSIRNLGRPEESLALLTAEQARPDDQLDDAERELADAVTCTLALVLADLGREREAASLAIGALARHLPRYNRSMTNYARALVEPAE